MLLEYGDSSFQIIPVELFLRAYGGGQAMTMEWGFITALVLVVLVIILPAALVWYLDAGNIMAAIKNNRAKRTRRKAELKSTLHGDVKSKW